MKWGKRIVFGLFAVYLAVGFGLYFLQEQFIFQSTKLPPHYTYNFTKAFEEITLEGEGSKLNGIHFKVENPKGVIVYYHGNAGDLSRWGSIVQHLLKFEHDIIIMDYRGYGKSTGKYDQKLMYQDADLFYQYAQSKFPEENIVVYGRSLGTTFATYVTAQHQPRFLILETPFYSLQEVASSRFPIYPIEKLLHYEFPTYRYAKQITCPTLIFHGTDDIVVPYRSAVKLYATFESPKEIISIDEGQHNNLAEFSTYWIELEKSLE